ncbi:1-deoxy-D-xylulose-5-phosphate reductoisomerase [Sulfuriroseicoccus oceanibius]|uniref:1-deoxy-D-xylulose 5-phosphate reductoisomerase n=1 Tax=Sulfuriroseicoccus oceanibius TaxID=2707525 RepID=A0A6B3LCP9_9BACT|nr:1-deoxy-D-xylulose-5-phosphate reductoisomerase [Sulfuriroseicoccus oceanibius]QQL45954.1 1-deoxy-D-xylulose-5-phosphate reductoisomerase [Sulfuriroseicoccus oceanibius]
MSDQRKIVVLGSTGSIGCSALKVARDIPERVQIVGMAAGVRDEVLADQIKETGVKYAAMSDPAAAQRLRERVGSDCEVGEGEAGLIDLATLDEADMVLVAIVGVAGLRPALAAIEAGKDLAIASKEILVMAGEVVMEAARRKGVRILPVDSEHNAIFQCLEGVPSDHVSRLILTASGGPFRTASVGAIKKAKPKDALKHPTWDMGRKISIDSATLFNKGLEMIEARWLFDVPMDRVDVIVHPQSIVHSMIETVDGSVLAQLSHSDMCFPIQYAVTYPDRVPNSLRPLNFSELAKLEFEAPREDVFPALKLARAAGTSGGTMPSVMNAANEVAVDAFLEGKIGFPAIWELVASVMEAHSNQGDTSLDAVVEADQWARHAAHAAVFDRVK